MATFSRWRPEGSLFNSYNSKMLGRVLLLSLDCATLPLIRTLYCWVLSKEVSSIIFKVFGMMQPGIEPRSPGPQANTLPTRPVCKLFVLKIVTWSYNSFQKIIISSYLKSYNYLKYLKLHNCVNHYYYVGILETK